MTQKIVIRQDKDFRTEFWSTNPHDSKANEFQPIEHILHLTPYGMLLASLGSCTAILLHSYAQNHGIALSQVEFVLQFVEAPEQECKDCDPSTTLSEHIQQEIRLTGELKPEEREKLLMVSHHCPIHRMLTDGVKVLTQLIHDS
jgi:uncharacterized OsmC-like protein